MFAWSLWNPPYFSLSSSRVSTIFGKVQDIQHRKEDDEEDWREMRSFRVNELSSAKTDSIRRPEENPRHILPTFITCVPKKRISCKLVEYKYMLHSLSRFSSWMKTLKFLIWEINSDFDTHFLTFTQHHVNIIMFFNCETKALQIQQKKTSSTQEER